jgi:hypothetical protein
LSEQGAFGRVKLAVVCIILLGVATLIASTYLLLSFFAIVGFSLVFWGTILLYLIPTKNNFTLLMSTVAEAESEHIERILTANNLSQRGLYLATEYVNCNSGQFNKLGRLANTDSVIIFIPTAPHLSQENGCQKSINMKDGFYIAPPGEALAKILEQRMGESFSKINLQQFTTALPNVLTKSLKLAKSVDVWLGDDTITIKVFKSVFERTCQETDKQPQTHKQVGCLLSSAIACSLAKVIGKPVTIESETHDLQAKITRIQYNFMANM